mmetsp:Transcript_42463/g.102279  ORF Transcript_42463/g.102279 Transcript_42463/m.102279 type:complete len:248 (+) Transcript_42463:487-1230(+)
MLRPHLASASSLCHRPCQLKHWQGYSKHCRPSSSNRLVRQQTLRFLVSSSPTLLLHQRPQQVQADGSHGTGRCWDRLNHSRRERLHPDRILEAGDGAATSWPKLVAAEHRIPSAAVHHDGNRTHQVAEEEASTHDDRPGTVAVGHKSTTLVVVPTRTHQVCPEAVTAAHHGIHRIRTVPAAVHRGCRDVVTTQRGLRNRTTPETAVEGNEDVHVPGRKKRMASMTTVVDHRRHPCQVQDGGVVSWQY